MNDGIVAAAVLRLYQVADRFGLLRSDWGRSCFIRSYYFYKKYWEDPLEFLLRTNPALLGDGVVFDVGANIGYTAAVLSRFAGPSAKIYCFEPDPTNCSLFAQARRGGIQSGRIDLIQSAVGETCGEATLLHNRLHPGDHRVQVGGATDTGQTASVVTITTLDKFYTDRCKRATPVDFVKIDVQGSEIEVCEGMRELLELSPHVSVYFECSAGEQKRTELLFDFFSKRGFALHLVSRIGLTPIADNRQAAAGITRYTNVLATREPVIVTRAGNP